MRAHISTTVHMALEHLSCKKGCPYKTVSKCSEFLGEPCRCKCHEAWEGLDSLMVGRTKAAMCPVCNHTAHGEQCDAEPQKHKGTKSQVFVGECA